MAADADLNARVMRRFNGVFDAVRFRVTEGIAHGEVNADVDPTASSR